MEISTELQPIEDQYRNDPMAFETLYNEMQMHIEEGSSYKLVRPLAIGEDIILNSSEDLKGFREHLEKTII